MRRVLTPKGQATRARIVAGAAEVVREKGVTDVTLDDVRSHTGTSKSQLFHYFPEGKDALLLAVARYEAEQVLNDQQPHLARLDTWEAWCRWRDVLVERYESQGDQCPLYTLFLQVGRNTPGSRAIVRELLGRWQQSLAAGIRALQRNDLLPLSVDADESAAALLAAIQGGVSIMLSTGESHHLRTALDWWITRLRAQAPQAG
ncbi:TetR/AcrR family transcriptional regulator [Nonomuraea mesophila]|uniref:TetR/AcrR family transcriptional regulator n=1 Tax=Nonomuraea mesophila TaxID=2530382 RepID=A0A4R5FXY8_9ACTN|nr:TetR/AcrR family transcriptional regulator [Nonomuraea mesophila]TDE59744.1 TetR/AcrR family transcriptional regulator [Nonomuraea mesophila]